MSDQETRERRERKRRNKARDRFTHDGVQRRRPNWRGMAVDYDEAKYGSHHDENTI